MSAIVFDCETNSDADDREIIEAAWVSVSFGNPCIAGPMEYFQFRPQKPITMGAMATHHIMEEDLEDCPPSSNFRFPEGFFLIGHNIDFDWKSGGSPNLKRICTLALSRYLWPECDSHKQAALLYYLNRSNAREMVSRAHAADADVSGCLFLLNTIIAKTGVENWGQLWELSEVARVPTVMTFGKHKGVKISEVPNDYKAWLLRQPDVDEYLRKALTR